MPVQLFTNNAVSTLAVALGIGVLSLTVDTGDGALFPSPTGGDWFIVTLESGATREIVRVTARAGDVFTIVRAQEGTSDQSWSIGDSVELRTTTGWLDTVHTEDSLPAAGIGDVFGPGTSVDNRVVFFDGTSGKTIKDSGLFLSGSNTGDQIISDATISITDITTNDFTTSKHGFVPKGTNVGKYLKDDGTWAIVQDTSLHDAIINGMFQVWQREESFTSVASGAYTADRWRMDYSTGGSVDVARQSLAADAAEIFALSGQVIQSAMRIDVNTIDASVAAGDFMLLSQFIEGNRALPYMHNEFTVSFYVRSNVTGTHTFSIRGNPASDRAFLKTFTIDVADTWERKEITVPVQDRTGSWSYDTEAGFLMGICLMAGTTFESTDDQWNSGNFLSVSGASNWMDTATNNFDITGVQFDLGPAAFPLRGVPFAQDVVDCQRYYYHTFIEGEFPTNFTLSDGDGTVSISAYSATVAQTLETTAHPVPMRAAPTVLGYSFDTGSTGVWRNATAAADQTANPLNTTLDKTTWTFTGTVAAGDHLVGHWTAEAEL